MRETLSIHMQVRNNNVYALENMRPNCFWLCAVNSAARISQMRLGFSCAKSFSYFVCANFTEMQIRCIFYIILYVPTYTQIQSKYIYILSHDLWVYIILYQITEQCKNNYNLENESVHASFRRPARCLHNIYMFNSQNMKSFSALHKLWVSAFPVSL